MSEANFYKESLHNKPSLTPYDLTSMAYDQFQQLKALFSIISKDVDSPTIKSLASTGNYLCDDWGDIYDCENERIRHDEGLSVNGVKISNGDTPAVSHISFEKSQVLDNKKELMAILCEFHSTFYFINDTSKLLQQRELFDQEDSESFLTPAYYKGLAEAIYKLTNKQLGLMEKLEEELGVSVSFPTHKADINLFDMASDAGLCRANKGVQGND
jgi:hypothetical protein